MAVGTRSYGTIGIGFVAWCTGITFALARSATIFIA
jgi:hypothetical protein